MTGPAWDGKGVDPWLSERLAAAAEVTQAERAIRQQFWAELSGWLVETGRAVMRDGGRPDPHAVWARVPAWREAVEAVLRGQIFKALGIAFRKILGPSYAWDQRVFVSDYLAQVRNRLVRIPDEVFDLIAHEVATGVNLGETIPQLRDRIDTVLSTTASERWPNRATVIARTECLPGDAVVNGAYATGAYRRAYSGPMVTVETMGGRQFTGTPNHPVLTPDGWIGLGALLQGDHLVCDRKSIQATGAPGDHDVDARQTTIAQVFDAAQAVGVTCREATAQPDFHGDGQDGYVDVLRSFGVLPVGRFAAIDQRSVDLILPPAGAEEVALACLRAPFARSAPIDEPPTLLGVAPGIASLFNQALDDLQISSVFSGERFPRGACPVPGHDLFIGEIDPQGRMLTAGGEEALTRVGERAQDTTPEQDQTHLIGAESGVLSDLPVAEPGRIELDEVVSIEVSHWSGHVYNLTTVNGYFVSGGVYTGNTIGALNAGRSEAFRAAAETDPELELERVWLCVLPSTPVLAAGVSQVARRWYDGEVWELGTALGRRVSLTPKHPVLTARGWIPAQSLHLGDQLLSVPGVDPVRTPGVEGRYALIEECFDAAAESGEVRTLTREVPSGVNLDSDLVNEEVQVVSTYGDLVQGLEASAAEDLGYLSLELSDETFARLVVEGTAPHSLIGHHDPGPRRVPRCEEHPGGYAIARGPNLARLAPVSDLDISETEHPTDSVRAGTVSDPQSVNRGPSLVVTDDLVSIKVGTWSGHVYDFTTSCHWFLADGIVVHNSTEDHRTRTTHRAADGQRVALASPFIVGGAELMFPGDPSGPPQETIQCRCSLLLVEQGESVDMSNRQFRRHP